MTEYHPITPPASLIRDLWDTHNPDDYVRHVSVEFARWGANQELDACCAWLIDVNPVAGIRQAAHLRKTRRPDPSSMKAQALGALGRFNTNAHTQADKMVQDFDLIRRALEKLDA